MTSPLDRIDTVVIGGSAGAFTALKGILAKLPQEFPAAVLVCLHLPATQGISLASLLSEFSSLPTVEGKEGSEIQTGTVTVAVPDQHMMIGANHIHLRRGAHENNFRPAIDPLFRSAAVFRGPRAIGVVLSGLMDDGAAGARALVRTGGQIFVQSPQSAEFSDMPAATLRAVPAAVAIELECITDRLVALAGTPCAAIENVPWDLGIELKISALEGATMANEERLGVLSPYNCPHCNGVLWEIEDGPMLRFRCHTGHGYTLEALGAAQEQAIDQRLFDTLRAHRGRAALLRKVADQSTSRPGRKSLIARAEKVEEDANRLEEIIRNRETT